MRMQVNPIVLSQSERNFTQSERNISLADQMRWRRSGNSVIVKGAGDAKPPVPSRAVVYAAEGSAGSPRGLTGSGAKGGGRVQAVDRKAVSVGEGAGADAAVAATESWRVPGRHAVVARAALARTASARAVCTAALDDDDGADVAVDTDGGGGGGGAPVLAGGRDEASGAAGVGASKPERAAVPPSRARDDGSRPAHVVLLAPLRDLPTRKPPPLPSPPPPSRSPPPVPPPLQPAAMED